MNKLLELLNEYKIYTDHKKSRMSEYVWTNVWDDIVMDSYVWTTKDKTLEIISKKFWFIKWLVKNDKVDLEKLDTPEYIDLWDDFMKLSDSDYLTMLLSIQDNPIEFLVSILK